MKRATRILVVDDEPEVLSVHAEMLRSDGYEVWEADTGEKGLAMARQLQPDLALVDVMLPGISGLEVCARIKGELTLADCFVVLVSGAAISPQDKINGLATPADDYLVKPVEMREFLARMRTLIRLRDTTAALRQSEEHHRRLVEILPDAVGLIDLEGRILEANRVAAISLGCASPADLVGRKVFDLIRPEEHERLRANIALTLQTGATRGAEYTMLRPDGRSFPVELSAAVLTPSLGQPRALVVVARDITERKRAEETLRRREELGRRTIDSAMDGFCRFDLEGRILECNEAFGRMLGYSRKELLSLRIVDLEVSESSKAEVAGHLARIAHSGSDRFETRHRCKDGRVIEVEVSAASFELEGPHLFAFARDITERKRAERQKTAFARLGHRLGGAATSEEAARVILDIASDLMGWDAGYIHLCSGPDNQIVSLLVADTVDGERVMVQPNSAARPPTVMMRRVMKEGAQLIDPRQESAADLSHPAESAASRAGSLMYVPLHLGGAVVGILSLQSYTPDAYSREDLRLLQTLADHCGEALHRIQTRAALQKAEAKYRSIFENATEGLFQTTPGGLFMSANPTLVRMMGFETAQELMTALSEMGTQVFVLPARHKEFERLLAAEGAAREFEAELYRKDKSRMWASLSARAVRDAHGAILFYQGSCQDITERKRAEEELRQLPRRIFEAQEAERIRVARELHDGVNQIIASAKMRLHNLGEKLVKLSPASNEIPFRCQRLLGQALEENRRIARDLRPSDLDQLGLVDACRNLARQVQAQSGLTVKCRLLRQTERFPPEVELHLFRIVQEALNNVVKHANAKTVQLLLSVQKDSVMVRLRDDGCGFAPKTALAAKSSGRGNGLTNMRERAAFLGGTCEVASTPNAGTTVTVRVPFKSTLP